MSGSSFGMNTGYCFFLNDDSSIVRFDSDATKLCLYIIILWGGFSFAQPLRLGFMISVFSWNRENRREVEP